MDQSAKEIAAPDLGLGGERGVVGVTAVWWEEVESAVGSVPVVVLAVGFARGSAELGQLVAQQAGAEEYASKLPGLARLSGLQGVRETQAAAQRDLAQELGRIRSGVPGLIAQSLHDARQREFEKGAAKLAYQGSTYANQLDYEAALAREDAANRRAAQAEAGRTQRASHAETGRNRRANAGRAQSQPPRERRRDQQEPARADAGRLLRSWQAPTRCRRWQPASFSSPRSR